MEENSMRAIRIGKVTLNVGCGDDPQKIERAKKLLEKLTEQTVVITKSKKRSKFGVPKGKPIGVKVTLRKKKAEDFFKNVLESVGKKIKSSQLDKDGNINFGIKEYIDLPNIRYDHAVGMLGLDVAVTLERPGYRIKYRRIQKRDIPKKHKINKEDTINWLKQQGVEVE
jgi:large subunit ribosomal protein L5